VTYLDRSAAAMAVAQARAAARGLSNIVWEQRSLLDLPGSGLAPFDYVDCCGVLHHLPDPAQGLAALTSVLAPRGGIGLMLYAPHGRTGVYMLQDALRLLAPPEMEPASRLDVARRLMRNLPDSAWLRMNRSFSDHLDGGDAGLYVLLLNPRDRAYDIASLHALLDAAGLRITALMEPMRYDPAAYLPDARLRARIATLDVVGRAALAEAICGNIATHVLYCVRAAEASASADPMDPAAVPVAREKPAAELARAIRPEGTVAFLFDGLSVKVPLPKLAAPILALVDGQRSVAEIGQALAGRGIDTAAFQRAWRETWDRLSALNQLLLAAPA
jgi:SAM-dependent methyltransferase